MANGSVSEQRPGAEAGAVAASAQAAPAPAPAPAPGGGHVVARIRAEDWARYRALRLAMLADSPTAFGERREDALALPEAEWRSRAVQMTAPDRVGLVAVGPDGGWSGMVGALVDPQRAEAVKVVSVWVHPEARGRAAGVAELLMAAALDWARRRPGAECAVLNVHERNARAIAFYQRLGFAPTGHSFPYPLDTSALLLQLELKLPAGGA